MPVRVPTPWPMAGWFRSVPVPGPLNGSGCGMTARRPCRDTRHFGNNGVGVAVGKPSA